MILVHVRELLPFHRSIVSAVVKSIALPGSSCKLCPFNMIVQQLASFGIHYIDFLPVWTTTRNGIAGIFSIIRKINACQSYRTIIRKFIRIKKYTWFTVQAILYIQYTLVLQTVILIEVILAVFLERCTNLFIISHIRQSLQQSIAERYLRQIVVRYFVLSFHPCSSCSGSVILQPTIRVGYFCSKIDIYSIHFRGFRIHKFLLLLLLLCTWHHDDTGCK